MDEVRHRHVCGDGRDGYHHVDERVHFSRGLWGNCQLGSRPTVSLRWNMLRQCQVLFIRKVSCLLQRNPFFCIGRMIG